MKMGSTNGSLLFWRKRRQGREARWGRGREGGRNSTADWHNYEVSGQIWTGRPFTKAGMDGWLGMMGGWGYQLGGVVRWGWAVSHQPISGSRAAPLSHAAAGGTVSASTAITTGTDGCHVECVIEIVA